jgi:hypothetical protein
MLCNECLPLTITIPAILGRLLARVPYVFEVRDLWSKVPIAMGVIRNPIVKALVIGLEWLAYRYAAHAVALSPSMAEGVRARCKQATQRVTVISIYFLEQKQILPPQLTCHGCQRHYKFLCYTRGH